MYLEAAGIYVSTYRRYTCPSVTSISGVVRYVHVPSHDHAESIVYYRAPGTRKHCFFNGTRSINFGFNALEPEIRFDEKPLSFALH